MNLVGDERAQSIQIGAVLLFGVLIIAFSSYQAFVVPDQNQQIEFNHNQEAHSQMQDLRNAIVSSGGTSDTQAVSVQLGTQYPSRAIARNPPPPSGSLDTVGSTDSRINLTIENASASGEVGDFWDDTQAYNTGGIVYSPTYYVYDDPPETIYENTLLYNQFPTGNLTLANQTFIDGTEISFVALNGSLSRSTTASATVDVRAASSSTQRVTLEDNGNPITLTFASSRSADYWEFLTNTESSVTDVRSAGTYGDFSLVTVELATGQPYQVKLTKVGVGTGVTDDNVAYLTNVDGDGAKVAQGETTELTVEVRDRYNNPPDNWSSTRINASVDGAGSLDATSKTPDADGQATFEYMAPSSGTPNPTVQFSYVGIDESFDSETVQNASMDIEVQSGGSGGGGASSGAGNGGTSTYSTGDDTVTVSGENGLWRGITFTDQLRFSDAVPVLTSDGYDRVSTSTTFRNDTHNYTVRLEVERATSGSFNIKSVQFVERTPSTSNINTYSLTSSAAKKTFDSPTYDGLNTLEPENYQSPSSVEQVAYDISQLDSSTVDVVFSGTDGRTDATLWDRTLITAAQPDPEPGHTEFVALNFTTPVDTTDWTLTDGTETTDLPSETVSGTVYLAADPSTFTSQHSGVAASQVYQLNTGLEDSGEALSLIDADGATRDELAYSGSGTASPQTSRGWTVTNVDQGDVTYRIAANYFKQDSNTASDWQVEAESSYFGGSGGGSGSGGSAKIVGSGATTSGNGASVSFTLENTGGQDATISGVGINNTTTSAQSVGDGGIFSADGSQVVTNAIPIDDSTADATRRDFTSDVTVPANGGTVSFEFDKFKSNNNGGGPPVDMSGSTVYITFYFDDGSIAVLQLDVS